MQKLSELERAVMQAVAYSDLYDFPLTEKEIQRYLPGVSANLNQVKAALAGRQLVGRWLEEASGYYCLPGRNRIGTYRRYREKESARLWKAAIYYGGWIARLPYVRMLAVTGALAVENVDQGADIDYLVVTETGRLWLCRAMVILAVKMASRAGFTLCPNYLLTTYQLTFSEQNLYAAREIAQMVPLAGQEVYARLRQENNWTRDYLPNAEAAPDCEYVNYTEAKRSPCGNPGFERVLNTPLGGWLESWEMRRKIGKLSQQANASDLASGETCFSADCCKGHFHAHGRQAQISWQNRLQDLQEALT